MVRTRRTILSILAGVAMSVGMLAGPAVPQAAAQMRFGARMGAGGFGAEKVDSSDVERYVKILDLTKTQQDALKALHEAYEADFDAAQKALQSTFEKVQQDFQDTQDPSVWQKDLPEAQEKFQNKTKELNSQFEQDLKAMLTGDQTEKWPAAERANRRAKSLTGSGGFGMGLAGESIDLIKMVDDMKLAKQSPELTQVLGKYETEIDAALVARDKRRKEIGEAMQAQQRNRMKEGGGFMPDFGKLQEQMNEIRKLGVPVRDINDRYSTLIASALPEDRRDTFAEKYKKDKFPNIYNEPYAMKALNAAKGFKDLTDEQRKGIDEIVESYQRDVAGANERYCKAQTEAEKDGGGDDMLTGVFRMMGGGDQGKDESELSQAKKARRKLDSDALDKLKHLLTPDQKDRLPERENDMFQWGAPRRR
jgi:Spy/CpxP family protein refolding chaperone